MKKQIPRYIKSKTYLYYPISNNKKVGLSFFSDKELPEDKYEALILKDEILTYDGHHYSEIEEGYAWIKPEIYLEVPEKFIPLYFEVYAESLAEWHHLANQKRTVFENYPIAGWLFYKRTKG